ncbi:MAG: non-canonical purine NTP pyrophosphatase [Candidatus Paceibacteria bacterium]
MKAIEVIFATRNATKLQQANAIFAGSGIILMTLDDAGIEGEALEDGTTLEENALKKARFAYERSTTDSLVMGEDTGLFINALGGKPGVYSARWAGKGASAEQTMQYCIKQMKGIEDRRATFRTVVVLLSDVGKEYLFIGEAHGHLLEEPRTDPQPNMPYSPIFVPEGQRLCFAEIAKMLPAHKNGFPHRAEALRKLKKFLEA